jgi:hypothetical protein
MLEDKRMELACSALLLPSVLPGRAFIIERLLQFSTTRIPFQEKKLK